MHLPFRCFWLQAVLLLVLLPLPGHLGCATRPKVDWNSRVSAYSFDQAITELGPPEKSAELSDGTLVAEWLTARGYSVPIYNPPIYYGYGYGYYCPPGYAFSPRSPDYFLRLTFNPGRQLSDWKQIIR